MMKAELKTNPKKLAQVRARYHADKAKALKKVADWKKANPDKLAAQHQRRKARMAESGIVKSLTPERKAALDEYGRNPETKRARQRRKEQRQRSELRDKYIARTLDLNVADCPQDLLEAKRELIRAKRQLREQQQPDQQHAPES